MKKLVLALAVIASVSMISCTGNNAEQAEVTEDTTAAMTEEVAPVDTTVAAPVDTTVAAPADTTVAGDQQ